MSLGTLGPRHHWAHGWAGLSLLLGLGGLLGCTDLGGKPPLPSGIPNQEALRTPAGARQLYQGAVATFEPGVFNVSVQNPSPQSGALLASVLDQGLVSDELTVSTGGGSPLMYLNAAPEAHYDLDSRNLPEGHDALDAVNTYTTLQALRARAAEGIGALAQYDTADKALRGHLYALTGYAELYLADLFCSGVPLSTFDYNEDFTYQPGSSTDSVYADAARQFQAALPLVADSVQWLNLARVGLGRAYLNLGRYAAADSAVQAVPSAFVYQVRVNWSTANGPLLTQSFTAAMADTEGGLGLPYRSSGDPRTRGIFVGQFTQYAFGGAVLFVGDSLFVPAKYGDGTGIVPLTVASGLEARLIQAEAALHGSGGAAAMLDTLNAIRADSSLPAALALDPAAPDPQRAAVDTLFAERAEWLYLDGHRLGDLRRLLRRYGRLFPRFEQVFPMGPYRVPVPQYPGYGPYAELPIPAVERQINPFFTGCLRRGL